eukprot:COSAG02_NODE_365_length_23749_cov_13.908584_18_plen_221_part_00
MNEETLNALQDEAAELDRLEQQHWHEYNRFTQQREGIANDRDSMMLLHRRLTQRDEHLRHTNVFNDTFHISHDQLEHKFGTINGLRLGTLPAFRVEWAEINAAWGMEVARECSAATAPPLHSEQQKPRRRWGRRTSKSAAMGLTLASPTLQQLREHYNALEAGGEHQLTPTPSCSGSTVSLSPPLMPTVSADVPTTVLQDEATQEAVDLLERAVGEFRRR